MEATLREKLYLTISKFSIRSLFYDYFMFFDTCLLYTSNSRSESFYRCWRQQRQPCGRTATFWWLGVSKLYGHILRDAIDRKSTTSLLVYGFKVGLVGLFLFSLDLCECRRYCILLTELHFRRILLHFRENRDFSRAHQYNKVRKDDERWSISRAISTALSTVSLTL